MSVILPIMENKLNISLFLVGQCPGIVDKNSLTSCEGMTKQGVAVFVDFYKINRPCHCIVTPSFDGTLLVTMREVLVSSCNTEINVQNSIVFGCPIQSISSQALNVQINQLVEVRAEYILPHAPGTFYHCLGLQQNGGSNGNLSVVCGTQLEADSTLKISTTTVLPTTRLSSPTTAVLSFQPTSAITITNPNIINTTAAIVSEEAESLVSLQIPLAVFMVISTISAILNIFFFVKIRLRNKSETKTDNTNVVMNHQRGNHSTVETYTELGNTVSGESENQYDSISRQDNYINTNVV